MPSTTPAADELPAGELFAWDEALPRLETERLVLRHPVAGDATGFYEIFCDAEVVRYWSRPAMESVSEGEELVREADQLFAERSLFQWTIALRSTGQVVGLERDGLERDGLEKDGPVIGTATLWKVDVENQRAELGFAIGRAGWGRGYATEAVTALLDFAFGPCGLHRIEADVDPGNERSLRLLRRFGFVDEGLLRHRWFVGGEYHDSAMLGLLADDWQVARRQLPAVRSAANASDRFQEPS